MKAAAAHLWSIAVSKAGDAIAKEIDSKAFEKKHRDQLAKQLAKKDPRQLFQEAVKAAQSGDKKIAGFHVDKVAAYLANEEQTAHVYNDDEWYEKVNGVPRGSKNSKPSPSKPKRAGGLKKAKAGMKAARRPKFPKVAQNGKSKAKGKGKGKGSGATKGKGKGKSKGKGKGTGPKGGGRVSNPGKKRKGKGKGKAHGT